MTQSDDRTAILAALMRKFCRGGTKRTETNALVKNMGRYVRQYLRDKVEGAGRAEQFESREQFERHLDTLAQDATAGLFKRKNDVCKLCSLLRDVLNKDDGALVGALQDISKLEAESHFYHDWRYNDPISFLVQDAVKDALSKGVKSGTIMRWGTKNTEWVASGKVKNVVLLSDDRPMISAEEIAVELARYLNSKRSLQWKIEQFLDSLMEDDSSRWFVDQNELINAVRSHTASSLQMREEVFGEMFEVNVLLKIAIDKAVATTCAFCRHELDGYVADGVFAEVEAKQLANACNDMVRQWAFDGSLHDNLGYLKAIQTYAEQLTSEGYNNRYKTRIGYIMKRAKALFKDTIRKNYGN